MITYFGVRHLSPASSAHLLTLLEKQAPDVVLIEGSSDLDELMLPICDRKTIPPIAIMAYTDSVPIQTILYPLAEYSPEYQAILWAYKKNKECRFIDLPSSVFLALSRLELLRKSSETEIGVVHTKSIYEKMEDILGEEQETFWERTFEHNTDYLSYMESIYEYGKQLRETDSRSDNFYAENLVRESYMIRQINKAIADGYQNIVVVTGAYHTEGLKTGLPMTDSELKKLPNINVKSTLMPYSYYRLSSRSGYGAGNKAPAYYELLWQSIRKGNLEDTAIGYLSKLADYQRKYGNITSSAEVIEAVLLSKNLAGMNSVNIPTLQDLRDSAIACMGHGNLNEISLAVADTEIGTKIGSLPEGVSRTSIQEDFYSQLKSLRLERYKASVKSNVELDLRENTRVKSEKSAFLDLNRSFFLHRLQYLGIHFCVKQHRPQDNATWAELWNLRWTPECEIEIVETALKGDTIELAAGYVFKESLDKSDSIAKVSDIINTACMCGMSDIVLYAVSILQGLSISAVSITEIAETINNLSMVVRFGNIRKTEYQPLIPVMQQLFYRSCLILPDCCACDNSAINGIIDSISIINNSEINHEFLDTENWISAITEISNRDNLNTKASGFCAAILLERGKMSNELLSIEVERRLSYGIPADLGANWFEGLSMKNRYTLIARLSLWEKLSEYIDSLDDDEFKRAVVFLRRSFCNFSAYEKQQIAENLGEIWKVNPEQVSEFLNSQLTEEQEEMLSEIEDFDFDDI